MNRKSTYRNLFLAASHIPLAMLLSVFAITSYSSQEFHYNKQLGQTEWVSFNRKTSKVGKISFRKALRFTKRNNAKKPRNWKTRNIIFNRKHLTKSLAYIKYSLTIELHHNFNLFKVIPLNTEEEFPAQFVG